MSPAHRDGAGAKRVAPTWESLADRLIREAQERGEWETGGWEGRRLPAQDGVYEGELAAGHAVLRNAGVAPPWVETDREARRLLAERARLLAVAGRTSAGGAASLRRQFEALLLELDRVLLRLEIEAPTPAQQRPRVVRGAELAALEVALASRGDTREAPPPVQRPPQARRRFPGRLQLPRRWQPSKRPQPPERPRVPEPPRPPPADPRRGA